MRPLKAFKQQPRRLVFVEMMALMLGVGGIDLITGYEISLVLIYGIPILGVAWFCDKKLAILAALIAAILWSTVARITGHPHMHGVDEVWEIAVHLGFFLFVAWAGSTLRLNRDNAAVRIALLEHSQRLEREIINISDAERRRIGQDLHDGLCQNLAALSCSATSLRDDLEKLNLPGEANVAGELAGLLSDAVVQTRDLARGLHPVRLDQVGLVLALEALAQSVKHLQGVNCSFECEGAAKNYDDDVALNLYRIVQEAINNATRHGKAQNIDIFLSTKNGKTLLRISDDGVGIEKTGPNHSGMGLSIMRYRAHLNGGYLMIEQPKDGGTTVLCTAKANENGNEAPAY
jgi:signal transduction histidine kinase